MIAWSIHKRFVHPPAKKPVLLGYGKLLGGEPSFLPAEDVADWDSDDAWMDLDARTVGVVAPRLTAASRKAAQADEVQEPSGQH